MWQGIIVKGNRTLPQTEQNQGTVVLQNGATIENAECGIFVGNPNNYGSYEGGIVKIEDATIKNCIKGIYFYDYPNENISYIHNSTFETTQEFYDSGYYPDKFIEMINVGTIDIKGNTFINYKQIEPYNSYFRQGKGIVAFNSDFNLKPYCTNSFILPCPEEDKIKNSFENLYVAVETSGNGSFTRCNIDQNNFVNNWVSISLNSVDDAEITSNDINVYAAVNISGQSGIYIVNSNGFHIEDNDIYTTSGNLPVGIFIRDCRAVNEIYRNRFSQLYTGIYSKGNNTAFFSMPPNYDGLQVICNEFNNVYKDIYVATNSQIATSQGSEKLSAGNRFYPECSGGTNEFNNGGFQIKYFAEPDSIFEPDCNYNVNIFKADHNSCPSKLNIKIPLHSITNLNDSIYIVRTELANVTDGGDTEGLNETVEEAEDEEALKLRNELLSLSPFLSDTVMVNTSMIEDVLPAVMLKQVLSANPSAAKSDNVQNALDNRQNPLPQYMRNEINLGKDTLSSKEKLENKLSYFNYKKESYINGRITNLLLDTLPQSLDSVENILLSENNLHRTYQLINFYISQNRIQEAQNLLNDIPQNFELSNSEQTVYEKNSQFYNIKFNLKNTGKSWFEINDEQRAVINDLAQDSTASAGMKARAVLSLIERTDYGYPIPEIEQVDKSMNPEPEILPETFDVYPKIAKDYFIIEYALDEKENPKDIKIAVYDNYGNEIQNYEVKTPANQFLTECDNWLPGTYFCRKFNKGRFDNEIKIIIGNKNSSSSEDININDISDIENTGVFKIYPNPAKDYFFVTYNLKTSKIKHAVIEISDAKGSVIKNIKLKKKNNKIRVLTSNLNKGIYSVCLKINGRIINTKQIVIQ